MITYTTVTTNNELSQILTLQQKNLPTSISEKEKEKEGFVTVQHDFDILKKMNDQQPHIIAKEGENVIGYALSMVSAFKNDIEVLKPMFEKIDANLDPQKSYITMGQICIDKNYRKQGIFKGLYYKMQSELSSQFDLLITEVAANNARSLSAHYAIGFFDLLVYQSDQITWHLIQWDWRK